MTLKHSTQRLIRFGTVASIALLASACASQSSTVTNPQVTQTPFDGGATETATYLRYCDSLREEGDLYVAAGMCQRAYENDRNSSEALHKLGAIYMDMGNLEGALQAYATALSIRPEDNEARYGLAKVYMEAGQFDLATIQLKNAIARDPQDSRFYNAMGVIKDQLGEHKAAQTFYRQGLDVDPSNVALQNNMGLSLSLSGQDTESLAMLNEAASSSEAGSSSEAVHITAANLARASKSAETNTAPVPEVVAEPTPVAPAPQVASAPVDAEPGDVLKTQDMAEPAQITIRPKVEVRTYREPEPEVSGQSMAQDSGPNDIEAAALGGESYAPVRDEAPQSAELVPPLNDDPNAVVPPLSDDADSLVPPLDEPTAALSKPLGSQSVPADSSSESIEIAGSASGQAESAPTSGRATEAAAAKLPSDYLQQFEEPEQESVAQSEPATTQVATVPAQSPSDESAPYRVQVGSYGSPDLAFRGWGIIAEAVGDTLQGYTPEVIEADMGADKGIVYRVRTGAFTDKADGDALCAEIQAQGQGCFVVKVPRQDDGRQVFESELTTTQAEPNEIEGG